MLADSVGRPEVAGTLDDDLLLGSEWHRAFLDFVAGLLPTWRDDPSRPLADGETKLTAQLCARISSALRHSPWDFLQVRREEPDEMSAARSIDFAVAPAGLRILVEGRTYTEYNTLLPIECKRLPTPKGHERDEREYLFSRYKTTGGVQRFKAGHHASLHSKAVMIGYIQKHNITHWASQTDQWISQLEAEKQPGWRASDKLALEQHDTMNRLGWLRSRHKRDEGLTDIALDHLWIEM